MSILAENHAHVLNDNTAGQYKPIIEGRVINWNSGRPKRHGSSVTTSIYCLHAPALGVTLKDCPELAGSAVARELVSRGGSKRYVLQYS